MSAFEAGTVILFGVSLTYVRPCAEIAEKRREQSSERHGGWVPIGISMTVNCVSASHSPAEIYSVTSITQNPSKHTAHLDLRDYFQNNVTFSSFQI